MKRNGFLLIVQAMLAGFMALFMMPQDAWSFFINWCVAFCFWFLMLAPAWKFKESS